MFALFAIAGVFLAVCRHGHVLVICDMIRSGELCVLFLSGYGSFLKLFLA
jgi:Kyakuja-Dileera-Zisupton transposase